MGLMEFFNRNQTSQVASSPKNQSLSNSTGNANIDGFCKRFFEKAGPDYQNTPMGLVKLALGNIGLIMEMLKSPEIKEIESLANNAFQKGLVDKNTVDGFSKVVNLFSGGNK